MDYSLIANSGIQLLTKRINIDLNAGYKCRFYESFDDEMFQWKLEFAYTLNNETVLLTSQLREKGYLDSDNNLTTSEAVVLANPEVTQFNVGDDEDEDASGIFYSKLANNNKYLEKYFNRWLPIPFIEMDEAGDYKNGPYNWSKLMIVPRGTEGGVLTADLLFAFDTRAGYYNTSDIYKESPVFMSEGETEKRFGLCGNERQLIDYCAWNKNWIRDCLMEIVFPDVANFDMLELRDGHHKYEFLATYLMFIKYLSSIDLFSSVKLMRDRDVNVVNVEMIIDIGNSRTSALLFENNQFTQDFTKVDPLKLQNYTHMLLPNGHLNREEDTFDMRLAFRKVSFGQNIMGSNQFVWPSIIRLGREANFLNHEATALNLGQETLSTNSSPKRYLWDNKPSQSEWRFVNIGNENYTLPPIIEGLTCFINDDGTFNPDGFGIGAHYSRSSLMTFAFIEIVQQALVQINSFQSRERHDLRNTPRRLERVIVTCPTAMSQVEREALYDSLKDAISIVNAYNNIIDENSISLQIDIIPDTKPDPDGNRSWYFDEATCSQFVYLYAQFCERYNNCSDMFFKLYGKKRDIEGRSRDSLHIGSVDIGAGTTDVMVCRYEYNESNPSQLRPVPLYWDSFNVAGDDMLQKLIQNVIIESEDGIFYKHMTQEAGMTRQEAYRRLYHFFGQDNNMMTFKDRIMRRDFNMQVNVPVMYHFLSLLSEGERYREVGFDEIFKDNQPSEIVCQAFKNCFGFELQDIKWTYDYQLLSKNVELSLDSLIESISTLLYAHDCDIVVLSGRPTMLKPIKDCFLRYFPVSPNRLVVLGKYRIGRWYPFKDENGYMFDTKSVVPVGAMIGYLASMTGGLKEFSLDLQELSQRLRPTTENFSKAGGRNNEGCFITPTTSTGNIVVNSFPCYIGAKQFDISIYPVRPFYVLDVDDRNITKRINPDGSLSPEQQQRRLREYRNTLLNRGPFKFEIEREDYEENKELLTIASVTDVNGEDLNTKDFMLQVQSINDPQCYWLDSGEFNLNIATTDLNTDL